MTWRQRIKWAQNQKGKASYRGAPFFIAESEINVGRRIEMHLLPNSKKWREFVWAEDLGAAPDTFTVEGYVVQSLDNSWDHFPERDKLMRALKTRTTKDNPGKLVHPYYGEVDVALAEPATIKESFVDGVGIARFTMTFVQFYKPIFGQQTRDDIDIVDVSVLDTINAALDQFTDTMNTAGAFLGSLTAKITNSMNKCQNAINSVKGAVASTINAAISAVNTAISLVDNLLGSPCDLANVILDAADAIKQIPGMAGEVVQGGIIGGCSGTLRGNQVTLDGTSVPETMGTSIVENLASEATYTDADLGTLPDEQADNIALVNNVMQSSMLANACAVAIRIDFSSIDQMETTLGQVADALDTLLNRIGAQGDDIDDPLLFQKLEILRGNFVKSMLSKNSGLIKETDYRVPDGVESALTLAYDKYNDITRDQEIFDRNKVAIKNPGFLPAGQDIRILDE